MGEIAQSTIQLLNYLISGFITAWIFRSFTPLKRVDHFERIIQALIFTVIINSSYYFIEWLILFFGDIYSLGRLYENTEEIVSVILAICYGLLFSYISNNDYIHKISRFINISQEHSYVSEMFYAFKSHPDKYIILTTKIDSSFEGRRIYGYPEEYPAFENTGHYNISDPSWVIEKKETVNNATQIVSDIQEMTGVECIMIPSKDVAWVEFIKEEESPNS